MATKFDFASLEQLRPLDHGDAIERFYWPKVSGSLSEYEVFWKRFVVLLTNRINPLADSNWIMLRDGIKPKYETLLMANYSTFYHCAVAQEMIETGRKAKTDHGFYHPQLFFFSAKTCIENLTVLKAEAGKLLRSENIKARFPASADETIHAITSYRNVFAHRSHLGRGSQHGRHLMPRLEHLPGSKNDPKLLWSYAMSLNANQMADTLEYQLSLWEKLAKYLQAVWRALAEAFEQFRLHSSFIEEVGLQEFLPIYSGIATNASPSLTNKHGASGMMIYRK